MFRNAASRPISWLLLALLPASLAEADVITVGSQAGAQIFFTGTLSRTYNFGVTQTGAGLSVTGLDVNVKGSNSPTAPVIVTLYSGLGGTGTAIATGTIATGSLTTQFQFISVPISTLTLATGGYSVVLTTTASENYYIKAGATKLTTNGSTSVTSSYWVEDTNTDGTAGTSLTAASPVLATWTLGTNAMAFGNYRVGTSLSSTTALVNTALVTSNTMTQALAATGSTAGSVSSLTGLPSPYLSVGGTSQIVAGLNGATTGPNSGTATLTFTSVSGTTSTTGTTAIGSGTIALTGTGWNWANAKVSSGTLAFGNVRTGSAATTQTVAVGNQAVTLAAYQDLLDVTGSTSNAKVTATGFQNLASSTNGTTTSNVSLAANTTIAGSLASTVSLTYASDANGVAGLSNGTATIVGGTAPTIATTGGVYDYAAAVYSGTTLAFGAVHQGASSVATMNVTFGNQTITNASFQDSLNVSASTGNALVTATGFTGLAASTGGVSTQNLAVSVNTATAGSLASTIALSLVSNANGVAGLSNGTATAVGGGTVTTTGQIYTGQSVWNTNGSGQWGTLSSNFGTNWQTNDGSPGLDAGFANADTATFGGAVTSGTATVTITAATPSVRSVTFSSNAASYVVAGASGGSLALLNAGTSAATVSVTAGSHTLSSGVTLNSRATIDVAAGSRFTVSGVMSGTNGIFKTGSGFLSITGANTYTGATTVASGTLSVNGSIASSSLTTVQAGATLAGSGTLGTVVVYGNHAPGNSPGVETTGALTYENGSSLTWELAANTTSGRGTNYDGINVNGPLTFAGSTSLMLSFGWAGSTVDWSDSFWSTSHIGTNGWLIYSGADSLTGFANLAISGVDWADSLGSMLSAIRPDATFSTYQSGNDVFLNYAIQAASVPEIDPAGFGSVAALVIGALGLLERRRLKAKAA